MADDAPNGPRAREPLPGSGTSGDLAGAGSSGAGAERHGPGDRVGQNYRLRRILGQGGMGDVWLAHNETLDVDVAVKFVRPASEEKDAAERLLSEARAAARLGDPAIVRVFDFGKTERGDPFIVMERLEGEDLATALGRLGRLNPAKAVRTLLPIAHALVAAHAKGIVHRDLKPENVFLARVEGDRLQPKIVDFGIAQVDRKKGLRAWRSGGLLGSLAYMAPEQARGEEVDHRADVWSFSVLLYEVIAGHKPFAGDTHDSVLQGIISGEPAPFVSVPGDNGALWGILRMGLEKDLAERIPSMRALGEMLAAWLLARGITEDITGASIETSWGPRSSSVEDDGLGKVRPLPFGAAREVREGRVTVHRGPSPAPNSRRSYLVLLTAGFAAVVGIAIGVTAAIKRRAAPQVAASSSSDIRQAGPPPPSGGPVRSVSPASSNILIPVEPLDRIPVDGRGEGVAAAKGAAKKTKAPLASGRPLTGGAPKRTLKDPFR